MNIFRYSEQNIYYPVPALTSLEDSIKKWLVDPSATGNKLAVIDSLKHHCTLRHYTHLQLNGLGLNKLPLEIGQLTRLIGLCLNNNIFSSLPSGMGQLTNLQELNLYDNQFTALPVEICLLTRLTNLKLGFNRLTFLPSEIGQLTNLTHLSLHNNCITSLPREIGNLTWVTALLLSNNALTSLPAEIGSLISMETLNLINNPNLLELPLNLGQIASLMNIEIGISRMSRNEETINPLIRDAVLYQCRMMRDAEAVQILPVRLAKWQALAKSTADLKVEGLTENQKITLNEWLLRLERTKDFAKIQSTLARTVCSILEDLLKNQEFQELFFDQAEANNACCEDRAAMSLNEIFTYWKLLFTPPQERVKMMTGVAKTLRLRKELQKRIHKHEIEMKNPELESVEIFLYYESVLSQPLQLVTAIQHMAHGSIGKRNWIDQNSLAQDVQDNFFEELVELPLFEKLIEKQLKELDEEFLGRLGECPEGSPNDAIVLDYQVRQVELMGDRKRRKIDIAKQYAN